VLLNGIEYTGSSQLAITPGGVSGQLLGIDAVREFNVLTEAYSAEYGKRSGAQVTVVTQSGTNLLHGTMFEFLRNSAMDARNTFDLNYVPPFRRNQFGGALGGPVKKDRLFLFGNYEGFQQRLAVSSLSAVPDSNARMDCCRMRQGSTQVTGFKPAMLPYFAFWPTGNGQNLGGGVQLAYYNPKQTIQENFGTLRGDYIVSARDTLSAAYTIDDGNSIIPLSDPLFASSVALRAQVASLRETHILSPTLLNSFTAGFSRSAFNFGSYPYLALPASLDFVTGPAWEASVSAPARSLPPSAPSPRPGRMPRPEFSNRRNLITLTDGYRWSRGSIS